MTGGLRLSRDNTQDGVDDGRTAGRTRRRRRRDTQKSEGEYLVHRHALRQVAREVRVDASQQGQFVGEELQRQHR